MRGRSRTRTAVTPRAASPPVSAARNRRPAGTAIIPSRTSSPTVSTFSPTAAAASTSISAPWRFVSSTITTASAPRGTIAPVWVRMASPGPTSRCGTTEVGTSPTMRRYAGDCSDAPWVSTARTAYPSIVERGNAGSVSTARTSSASTRPMAACKETISDRSIGEQPRARIANASLGGRTVKSSCTLSRRTVRARGPIERGSPSRASEHPRPQPVHRNRTRGARQFSRYRILRSRSTMIWPRLAWTASGRCTVT
jgi:hypothetical protein